jgi:hypothetical protein
MVPLPFGATDVDKLYILGEQPARTKIEQITNDVNNNGIFAKIIFNCGLLLIVKHSICCAAVSTITQFVSA